MPGTTKNIDAFRTFLWMKPFVLFDEDGNTSYREDNGE